MGDDRQDPLRRKGALLLSSLVLTPDEGLPAFAKRRVARAAVEPQQLERARAVLDAVTFVLRSERREDWRKLEQAWEILRRVEAPAEASEEPSGPAQIPGMPQAETQAETQPEARASSSGSDPSRPVPPPAPSPAPPPAVPPSPRPSAPRVVIPAPGPFVTPAPGADTDRTATVPSVLGEPAPALPFAEGQPAVAPPLVADALGPAEESVDETMSVVGLALADLGLALPFEEGPPAPRPELDAVVAAPTVSPGPHLTLAQYASLCAEREAMPERRAEVLKRYEVAGEDALLALDRRWEWRLQDASSRARFAELTAAYRAWLERQR